MVKLTPESAKHINILVGIQPGVLKICYSHANNCNHIALWHVDCDEFGSGFKPKTPLPTIKWRPLEGHRDNASAE